MFLSFCLGNYIANDFIAEISTLTHIHYCSILQVKFLPPEIYECVQQEQKDIFLINSTCTPHTLLFQCYFYTMQKYQSIEGVH